MQNKTPYESWVLNNSGSRCQRNFFLSSSNMGEGAAALFSNIHDSSSAETISVLPQEAGIALLGLGFNSQW
jgi:hypothetical protein